MYESEATQLDSHFHYLLDTGPEDLSEPSDLVFSFPLSSGLDLPQQDPTLFGSTSSSVNTYSAFSSALSNSCIPVNPTVHENLSGNDQNIFAATIDDLVNTAPVNYGLYDSGSTANTGIITPDVGVSEYTAAGPIINTHVQSTYSVASASNTTTSKGKGAARPPGPLKASDGGYPCLFPGCLHPPFSKQGLLT